MKYKLIGLYVVFFIIIFLIDNFIVINRIYSESLQAYRLGDAVKQKSTRENVLYTPKKYKYSIAAEYMNKNTNKDYKFNIDLLNNIVKKRTKIRHKMYDNYINIHVRSGDVMQKKYKNTRYVKYLPYYDKIIKYLKKNNINNKNVLIISGWHMKQIIDGMEQLNTKSLKHINNIKKLFEKNGYNVTIRLNEDPDEDFIIMSNSKYFVQSDGGYSILIGEMVKLNGNTLINEDTLK